MHTTHSQNLSDHLWKNRVLLVVSKTLDNSLYLGQIKELKNHEQGLKERKLIAYHITPAKFKKGLENNNWELSKSLYKTYNKSNTEYKIILIGLDGGIKHQQNEVLSCSDLFSIIDGMPMRQQEIGQNKKSN
ncbi:MAG: DUF4174 domain-containing protein [Flavobacteriaceae bacterium]|nr:DUF4174 domain-containing protein [Flavobacteriaceae bacterium]